MSIEIRKKEKLLQEEQLAYLSTHPSKRLTSFCFDDDDDEVYTSAITPDEPVLSTKEPDKSLSMGDKHLDTIPATELDEFIKSGVKNLIPIPSESEGIPEHVCDVPFLNNSPPLDVSKNQIEDFFESNEEFSSTDDDSFSIDNIDYVEASPLDSELVSSKVMDIVIPEVGGIKASNDNHIPSYDPIIPGNPLNLTPLGESDFFLEVDAFLAVEDESTSSLFPKSYLDPEGNMLLFEAFLNDDHSSDLKTKSSSNSLNSLLEETNNFHNSLPEFTTFSNVLCDAECESDSSDDQSCSDEDVLRKIVSKPLSEEEIIHMESLRIHDSSLPISSKIDSLLDEFAGELTLLKSIPPGIDETDCDLRKTFVLSRNCCTITLLLVHRKNLFLQILILKLNLSLHILSSLRIVTLLWRKWIYSVLRTTQCRRALRTKIMTLKGIFSFLRTCLAITPFHLLKKSHFDTPSFSRPPAKPPDGDTGILNIKIMGDISDQKAFMHKLMITLAPHQEKSHDLLSHRCGTVKKFNTHRSHLNVCPMLIHGQNNPLLDVLLFHFSPLIRSSMEGIWSSSFDLKQALRGRHPMLIFLGF
nr:hypothetical protein [Tanacetum cinerariifolium]